MPLHEDYLSEEENQQLKLLDKAILGTELSLKITQTLGQSGSHIKKNLNRYHLMNSCNSATLEKKAKQLSKRQITKKGNLQQTLSRLKTLRIKTMDKVIKVRKGLPNAQEQLTAHFLQIQKTLLETHH